MSRRRSVVPVVETPDVPAGTHENEPLGMDEGFADGRGVRVFGRGVEELILNEAVNVLLLAREEGPVVRVRAEARRVFREDFGGVMVRVHRDGEQARSRGKSVLDLLHTAREYGTGAAAAREYEVDDPGLSLHVL